MWVGASHSAVLCLTGVVLRTMSVTRFHRVPVSLQYTTSGLNTWKVGDVALQTTWGCHIAVAAADPILCKVSRGRMNEREFA